MKLSLIILRTIVCLLVFLIGLAFAGYTFVLVEPVLTNVDRFVLVGGFMIGLAATGRWLLELEFWANSEVAEDE